MVDAVTTSNATARVNSGSAMLVDNFETFLTLLTTQLKNQDPLSPLDSNAFTQQLTQMAGVEQQLLTNDLLTSLLAAQQGGGLAGASNYIGKDATAVWAATKFDDGSASWNYELGTTAEKVSLEVVDSNGKVVWKGDAPDKSEGVHTFTWDGIANANSSANAANGQVYSLKITAKTAADQTVDAQVLARGRVTGVEMYNGEAYLSIGKTILPLTSVIALEEVQPTTPNNEEA